MRRGTAGSLLALGAVLAAIAAGCGGSSSAETAPVDLGRYNAYVAENAADLTDWVRQMRGQIAVGEVAKAESRYATSRVQLGQISPAAMTVEPLFDQIDAVPAEAGSGTGGYHRIEKALFSGETTVGMKPVAAQLLEDVAALQKRLEATRFKPDDLAEDAVEAVRRLSTVAVQGGLEVYSHVDLVDMAAGVEGAEAAFEVAEPLVSDEELRKRVKRMFLATYDVLKQYGSPAREPQSRPAAAGARFVNYADITTESRQEIEESLERLLQVLEAASAAVGD
jgi:iron uptake system component EfeO